MIRQKNSEMPTNQLQVLVYKSILDKNLHEVKFENKTFLAITRDNLNSVISRIKTI